MLSDGGHPPSAAQGSSTCAGHPQEPSGLQYIKPRSALGVARVDERETRMLGGGQQRVWAAWESERDLPPCPNVCDGGERRKIGEKMEEGGEGGGGEKREKMRDREEKIIFARVRGSADGFRGASRGSVEPQARTRGHLDVYAVAHGSSKDHYDGEQQRARATGATAGGDTQRGATRISTATRETMEGRVSICTRRLARVLCASRLTPPSV